MRQPPLTIKCVRCVADDVDAIVTLLKFSVLCNGSIVDRLGDGFFDVIYYYYYYYYYY